MKIVFICVVLLSACVIADPAAADKRALQLTGGASVVISEDDAGEWKSVVVMKNEAKIEVRFLQKDGAFVSARATSGPYDYDLDPGGELLSFSEALVKARETGDGDVEAWTLEQIDVGFVWKIFLRDPQQILWETVLAADDGELQGMFQEEEAD